MGSVCLECPTDLVLMVALWRLRYTRSLRDLAACASRWASLAEQRRQIRERWAALLPELAA